MQCLEWKFIFPRLGDLETDIVFELFLFANIKHDEVIEHDNNVWGLGSVNKQADRSAFINTRKRDSAQLRYASYKCT